MSSTWVTMNQLKFRSGFDEMWLLHLVMNVTEVAAAGQR
jgi:hypothetical protein